MPARITVTVIGVVQAVGFRAWATREAELLGLTGRAVNQPDGTVVIIAEGSRAGLEKFLGILTSGATPGRVDDVDAAYSEATGEFGTFRPG